MSPRYIDREKKVDPWLLTSLMSPQLMVLEEWIGVVEYFLPLPYRVEMLNPRLRRKRSNTQNAGFLEGASSPKAVSSQKEVEKFLRIIKKSDYRVVDQLSHTPSKISILSLLLSLEAHRESQESSTHLNEVSRYDLIKSIGGNRIFVECYIGDHLDEADLRRSCNEA